MVKKNLKVVPIVMINIELLEYDTKNTNKQDRATYRDLKANIQEHGLDENLVVIPHTSIEGHYLVVSGNHRLQICKELGYTELPCAIHEDWNEATAYLQSVRRNLARGKIDKAAFTRLVDDLQSETEMGLSDIREGMGLNDMDVFADMYQADKALLEQDHVQEERVSNTNKDRVKIIENLELMISHILEEHGDTVPHSFIVVPVGGRKHLFVQTDSGLKNVLQKVAAKTVEKDMSLTTVLSGLLTIGLHNCDFLNDTTKVEENADEHHTVPDDTDFESINDNNAK